MSNEIKKNKEDKAYARALDVLNRSRYMHSDDKQFAKEYQEAIIAFFTSDPVKPKVRNDNLYVEVHGYYSDPPPSQNSGTPSIVGFSTPVSPFWNYN